MDCSWSSLPDEVQLALSHAALHRAVAAIAVQAEVLAQEMECGVLTDRGGPDALRLFAALVRVNQQQGPTAQGCC